MKNLKITKKGIAAILTSIMIMTSTSACAKEACTLPGPHVHAYTKDGIIRYINSEEEYVDNYRRSDDYYTLADTEIAYNQFITDQGLIGITDNEDYFRNVMTNNKEWTEYEKCSCYLIPLIKDINDLDYLTAKQYSWSKDKNNVYNTGKSRIVTYGYHVYGVKEVNGEFVLVDGGIVTDLFANVIDYPYVKENFMYPIDKATGKPAEYLVTSNSEYDYAKTYEEAKDNLKEYKIK